MATGCHRVGDRAAQRVPLTATNPPWIAERILRGCEPTFMNRTVLLVIIVAVVFALGITAWLIAGLFRSPVHQIQPRTCLGCVELHTANQSSIEAQRLSGAYRFREALAFYLSFDEGTVEFRGNSISAGCLVAAAERGDVLAFDGATDVDFEAPAADRSCG